RVAPAIDPAPPGPFEDVEAIIQAAGRGERLGRGPKAFLALGERTLLERAVSAMRAVARNVVVGVPPEDLERARELCGPGVLVLAGGATRRDTLLRIVAATRGPWLLLHDVVHPFATPALARQVVETARVHGASIAAIRSTSSVHHRPSGGGVARLAPGEVWLMRKPVAFRREGFVRGLDGPMESQEGVGGILRRAGQELAVVPAEPWNLKITTPEDWQLAEVIERGLASGDIGRGPSASRPSGDFVTD
ncbi:MAG: IspD/TarI family cytidylyltransferase, partial [Gammaproteobacteria bacterium]